jgi:hypothetical protein
MKSVSYVIPWWSLCPTSYLDEVFALFHDVLNIWPSDVSCTAPSPVNHMYPPPGHSSSHLQLPSSISTCQQVPAPRTAISNILRRTDELKGILVLQSLSFVKHERHVLETWFRSPWLVRHWLRPLTDLSQGNTAWSVVQRHSTDPWEFSSFTSRYISTCADSWGRRSPDWSTPV